ncbi:dihydroorotate dehydrogenase [Salirhabdus euzebyi]|uniref:Dihydroorotate dehydrogenase n=1 Tax=Salirhabdus euzebyi TaxID=394506 RepID=A0A841Q607_9BACI|nr:dihydroorotate dehydrogenase [Salirhabdus euzebyi]MBB6453804.1 dihydroorotate dehydrogenase [Salirhabdus euzebyi]
MPDWSYHPLKKILLDKMMPSKSRAFIHQAMNMITSIPGGRSIIHFLGHLKPSPRLRRSVNQIKFQSPIGLSGSVDPYLSGTKAFQELGFGFLEVGPIVLNKSYEVKPRKTSSNRIQFSIHEEKVLLKHAIRKLATLEMKIPIIARLDKDLTEAEWKTAIQHLSPYVDAFFLTDFQLQHFVIESKYDIARPVFVIQTGEKELVMTHLNQWFSKGIIKGVVLEGLRDVENGYWIESLNAREELINRLIKIKKEIPDMISVTSGVVNSPEDAILLYEAGADFFLLREGYVETGPGLPKRIQERILYEEQKREEPKKQGFIWSFLFGLSIFIGGVMALIFSMTSVLLPYDEAFIGLTRDEILAINPLVLSFMAHDRMALAGTMISGSILYIQLARYGIRYGLHWARSAFHTAAIVGFLGIFLFIGFGYFDWLHGIFWLLLLPIYMASLRESKTAIHSPTLSKAINDKAWKNGLIGQLLFVILGFSILLGGIIISIIGVSDVFVSTDLQFMCMSPEMLQQMNDKLIPVIAHDRAGFGGALVSVGLLVLMLSLWGYRRGEKWLWNTVAIGALPAFIAGIGTHLFIGYTTFIHLLPVYFLMVLYVLGLAYSYQFLKKGGTSKK